MHEFEAFISQITEVQRAELAAAYCEITRREDSQAISRWLNRCFRDEQKTTYDEVAPWIDTIIRLWDDEDFYAQERRRCLAAAQAWHPERLLPRFEDFFKQVLNSSARRRAADLRLSDRKNLANFA